MTFNGIQNVLKYLFAQYDILLIISLQIIIAM
jgi:hypothetical protein